jgi:phospholipid transport system substrate-binding protein
LEPAVNQTFALGFMARTSVGRAWSDLSADQQSAYLAKYAEWSIATFAGRFKKWTGEHFELVSVSEPESGTVTIDSELVKNDGSTVSFRYKLREGNAGWQVVDLHIDGVSQLALTRSQYAGVLKQQGMEGLLATLQQKIDDQKASSAE